MYKLFKIKKFQIQEVTHKYLNLINTLKINLKEFTFQLIKKRNY